MVAARTPRDPAAFQFVYVRSRAPPRSYGMQSKLGGSIAALCLGAALMASCGGGGGADSTGDTSNPDVGAKSATGGAPKNVSGSQASPAAAGAPGTTAAA